MFGDLSEDGEMAIWPPPSTLSLPGRRESNHPTTMKTEGERDNGGFVIERRFLETTGIDCNRGEQLGVCHETRKMMIRTSES